jgi:DNA-directed RNA polymerase sigma subunit (sigma70/sigma32)
MIDTVAAPEGDRVLDEQNAKHIRRALAILSPSEARVIRFRLALDDVKRIAPDKLRVWLD